MASRLTVIIAVAAVSATLGSIRFVAAQALTTEADVTAGISTQDIGTGTQNITAAAMRLRAFGDVVGWRFYGDASWAAIHGPDSDAFGAAYPYLRKPRLLELNVEKMAIRNDRLLGIRLGKYRTPFGIYSGSDQGYMGFLRAPLIRNSYYWALSNNYFEAGAGAVAGTTWLSAEASAGIATDEDKLPRPGGLNAVVRVQGATGPWIAGVSYIRTRPSSAMPFAKGRTEFVGSDIRWMKSGVQLRGEWITGRPFQGTSTRGGYADVLVHKQRMGPVTAVARFEGIDYLAGPFSQFPRRYTFGAKIRVTRGLTAQINHIRQTRYVNAYSAKSSLDIGLTYTIRPASLRGGQDR